MIRIDEYLVHIAGPLRRRPALPATVFTYGTVLRLFEKWLGARPVTRETAQEWLTYLASDHKATYVTKVAVCVQSYLQWALQDKEVYLEYRRGLQLTPPKFYYSVDDIERFLANLTGAPLCCATLEFDSGARAGALLTLRVAYHDPVTNRTASDLHLADDPPLIDIYLKGGKRGQARLTVRGVDAITQWLAESVVGRRRSPPEERALLFLDWTYRDIYDAYKKAAGRAGIPFHGTHTLRHSFVRHQLGAGADLKDVSQAIHHKNINTTAQIYAPLTMPDLSKRLKGW